MQKAFSGLEDSSKFRAIDGSGLSRANRVTARLETALLEKIYAEGKYDIFKNLLAQPGQWGTMRKQLTDIDTDTCAGKCSAGKGINIYAKTGTLPRGRVKSLMGFVESDKGVIMFSTVANSVEVGSAKVITQRLVRMHVKALRAAGLL